MYTISYDFLNDPVSKSDISRPQSKIEQKRKVYLSSELKKLGYNVSLTKVPQAVTLN